MTDTDIVERLTAFAHSFANADYADDAALLSEAIADLKAQLEDDE